jgi:hypothetical protein
MSDPGDQYQPFIDAIRHTHQQLDDAQAGWTWAVAQDPIAETSMWQWVERARCDYRHAVDNLIQYILQ